MKNSRITKLYFKAALNDVFNKAALLIMFITLFIFVGYNMLSEKQSVLSYDMFTLQYMLLPIFNIIMTVIAYVNMRILNKYKENFYVFRNSKRILYNLSIKFGFIISFFLIFLFILIHIILLCFFKLNTQIFIIILWNDFITVFCSAFTSYIFGMILGFIRIKIIPVFLILLMTGCSLGIFYYPEELLYNKTGIGLIKIIRLLSFSPDSLKWVSNPHVGYTLFWNKFFQLLFFSSFLFFIIAIALFDRKKSKKSLINVFVCSIICISFFVLYLLPFSNPVFDKARDSVIQTEMRYFDLKNSRDFIMPMNEEPDFQVSGYNMKLKAFRGLSAEVDVLLKEKNLSEYKFTLYNEIKVKAVYDENNNKLNFKRENDYITVYSKENTKYLKFKYFSSMQKFYANYAAVYLPGYAAYYPIPGFRPLFDKEKYVFLDASLPYEVDFNVCFNIPKKLYSNIYETDKNHFSGKAKSLTLMCGKVNTEKINDTVFYYPYLELGVYDKAVRSEWEQFAKEHNDIKKVFIVPNTNDDTVNYCGLQEDYLLSGSVYGVNILYDRIVLSGTAAGE